MNSRYMRNILRIGSVVTLTLLVAAALSCSNPLSESEQIKEEFLEEDTADITIEFSDGENASAVTKDLHLPNKINGTSVTWSSSNPSVIQNNGTVHRPAFDAEDKTVTLTAILDYDGTTKTKSFEVRVERLYKVTYETYHSQINGDLPVPQGADSYNIITLNDVSSLISRDGFNYVGWTTVPESSSPEFNPAEEIVLSGDLTLYPCWSEGSYNVVYDGNDGEYVGTATDVPASSTEEYNSEITVASQGSMARPGYTFAGWNTKEDGTGDHYDPEDSQGNAFTIPAQNTTLYAQWTPIEYSIAYELNGGSNVAGNPNSYTIENLPIMLEDASKTDFLFDGWVDGEDIPTNKIPIGSTMNVVLKAQWSQESVTFESVVQTGGTSGTSNSTGLILTFDVDPATLVADDITVTGASKGALTGSGTTRSLAISDIGVGDGEMVSVAITNPSGYLVSGSPKSAVVYKDTREAVTFESVVQTGGISGTKDSTALTLTFDVDPTTLVANNITVTGATNVALSVNGTTRTLLISGITVANGEMVSVAIADPSGYSISGSPRSAVVYKDTREAVTFESAVQIGGTSGIVDTTGLELSFDVDPSTLTADDITVNGATKGALSDNGATRSLAISDITVGDGETVSVAITNPSGYSISGSPKSAVVYKDTREAVTFESAVQIGGTSGTSDTTGLELSFDVDPATLAADDIVVTGATEGGLTGSGTNRNLAISDITVGDGETVSVAITNPSGYVINGSPRSAVVYKDTRTAVTFENAVQTGGTSDISDSTGLTLSFNIDPSTLAADNITVTGATKGALTGSGTTRNLAISDITVANGKTVTVAITNPSGYLISGSPQTAVVYKTPIPVTFQSAVQTGGTSDISDSTGLTLSFNIDPSTLAADNITVTGATRGALTGSGTTRNLAISDITVANGETVSVAITNPLGYLISGSPQTAVVYKAPIPVTFQSAVQTGGTSDISDSTGLTLSFDAEPSTLAADNITVTGATKGALTGSGTTRSLAISEITVANEETVSVEISDPEGYSISGSPQTAVVYKASIPVIFNWAGQRNGSSGTETTTALQLSFSSDPTTLTADNITLTGASKGTLTGSGLYRYLTISNITVANGETISVAISDPEGYSISGSPQSVEVYKDTRTTVTFEGAYKNNGSSGTEPTTELYLSFSSDPTTLTADNITVTGATKGTLTGSGYSRYLTISDLTVANGETVSVAITDPSGYLISGSPQTAMVYNVVIGTEYQGGKIAYVFQPGDPGYVAGETHGIIASSYDMTASGIYYDGIEWSENHISTGATGIALGTGQSNTTKIVNTSGIGSYSAAKLCADYTNDGYSDWYLPSLDELQKLNANADEIGNFTSERYWSSTEYEDVQAYQVSFNFGADTPYHKSYRFQVRAVRNFNN